VTYTTAWLLWLLAFGVIEGKALANKEPGDTLSEHVWKWFMVRKQDQHAGQGWIVLLRTVLAAGLGLLTIHLTTGFSL
jgi:hypothetical protein